MHIEPSPRFKKEFKTLAKKYPSLLTDFRQFEMDLRENPQIGESLGLGCYKIRLSIDSKSAGKSGGARVITCVRITEEQIDLLTIYDKSERSTIKKSELKKIIKLYVK
jgi:mRNA-degrading endonuclease RelE of RelBE toxin-antitoxin system